MSRKPKATTKKEEGKGETQPRLRFPEFRDAGEWVERNASDLFNQRVEAGEAGLPIHSVTMNDGMVERSSLDRRVDDIANPASNKKAHMGDVVYNMMRMWQGASGRASEDCMVSPAYVVLAPKRNVCTEFYEYLLKLRSSLELLTSHSQGLTKDRLRLYFKDFATIHFPSTGMAEQQRIASCLTSVDNLITAQAQKLEALKTHKKGLMQQLFPREGETQPRLRFPEFRDAGEWVLSPIGGLVKEGFLYPPKDGNHGNIHPKSSDYVAKGIPFIMASDLGGGRIDTISCHFISKELADTLKKGFAKQGDVLLSHKGTVGEVAVVREIQTLYLMLTPQVTYYRVKNSKKLSNEFLAQLFVSDVFQSNLLNMAGGGTRAYIGITEQAKLGVTLPKAVTEQQHIADCLTSLDDLIAAQAQKIEALTTHKKGLMQQLFPSPEEVNV